MAWNGWTVIDMDSHIVERPHEMYGDYIDAAYADAFARLEHALEQSIEKGGVGAIAANRYAVIALLEGLGADVTDLGILEDDTKAIAGALKDAASGHDLLVPSGGLSAG